MLISVYYAKVAPEYLDNALDWVSDILLNSKFEAKEIEREKGVIKEEINMSLDMPMRHVGLLWENLLYGDQPAGWDTIGTKENIERMARIDLLKYLKNYYKMNKHVYFFSVQESLIQNLQRTWPSNFENQKMIWHAPQPFYLFIISTRIFNSKFAKDLSLKF